MSNEEYKQLMECLHKLENRIESLEEFRIEALKTFDRTIKGIMRLFDND